VLVVIVAAGLLTGVPSNRAAAQGPPWNVVIIMTDDLDVGSLQAAAHPPVPTLGSLMPNYVSLFEQQGTVFTNSFVTYSLCCPSRTTFLTGQYAHNHGVLNNEGSSGGCQAFDGHDDNTLATWLHDAPPPGNYTTGLVGKYLNGYGSGTMSDTGCRKPNYEPAGWTQWHALVNEASKQLGYTINDNGTPFHASPTDFVDYQTKRLQERAFNFINSADGINQKFFLYVAPSAPHLDKGADVICSPTFWGDLHTIRDYPAFEGWAGTLSLPEPPNYDEVDISDKPAFFEQKHIPRVDRDCTETIWRDRLEAMKSVDVMIGAIAGALQDHHGQNILEDTVLIFTSDNGFYHGEHRLHGKILGYEEGLRVPLAVRYPGTQGTTVSDFVLNTDLAPTIAELAGVTPGERWTASPSCRF